MLYLIINFPTTYKPSLIWKCCKDVLHRKIISNARINRYKTLWKEKENPWLTPQEGYICILISNGFDLSSFYIQHALRIINRSSQATLRVFRSLLQSSQDAMYFCLYWRRRFAFLYAEDLRIFVWIRKIQSEIKRREDIQIPSENVVQETKRSMSVYPKFSRYKFAKTKFCQPEQQLFF